MVKACLVITDNCETGVATLSWSISFLGKAKLAFKVTLGLPITCSSNRLYNTINCAVVFDLVELH